MTSRRRGCIKTPFIVDAIYMEKDFDDIAEGGRISSSLPEQWIDRIADDLLFCAAHISSLQIDDLSTIITVLRNKHRFLPALLADQRSLKILQNITAHLSFLKSALSSDPQQAVQQQVRDTIAGSSVGDLEPSSGGPRWAALKADLEDLRKLTMGVALEHLNMLAINEQGELRIRMDRSGGVACHLDRGEAIDTNNMLFRQAVLRQIERTVCMNRNGVWNLPENSAFLDIGAGAPLIVSSMLRERYPASRIVAVEPGYIDPDYTRSIAHAQRIELHQAYLHHLDTKERFDTILLHFVLEHDIEQSRALLRQALLLLNPEGMLSITVPNFDAFHREFETALNLQNRDRQTRLGNHDRLVGHQIIFTKERLVTLIREVMDELGMNLPAQSQTILPRPLSFNFLAAMHEEYHLGKLDFDGHIPGMENLGSVLSVVVGKSAILPTPTDTTGSTRTYFKTILHRFLNRENIKDEQQKRGEEFLEEKYPELL